MFSLLLYRGTLSKDTSVLSNARFHGSPDRVSGEPPQPKDSSTPLKNKNKRSGKKKAEFWKCNQNSQGVCL